MTGPSKLEPKDNLHRLVDALPESEILVAERFLRYLQLAAEDPMLRSLLDAPIDDESTTAEEDAGAGQAWQEYLRGEVLSTEEARRALLS